MQALHYLLPLIFLIGSLKAENVQSMQEGDFFNPLVWSNQVVPNLTSDSIFINHNLYNYQEITIGNAGYLHISNCVFLCGDFQFTIDSGGYVFIDGTLYTEKLTVYGSLENNGYLSCTYKFTVSSGVYFGCGWGIVRNEVQNCTRKGPIRDTATEFSILNGTVLLEIDICKCTKKFDFGDNKIVIDGTGDSNVVSTNDQEVDCTIVVSIDDLESLVNGSLNPMGAFMMGKIKVKGDMGVAMKLQSFFKG